MKMQVEDKLEPETVATIHLYPDPGSLKTVEEKAILEVLLELCDPNLDITTTETEVRELQGLYTDMYRAKPFIGLRELVLDDDGVALFFDLFREQVVPIPKIADRRNQALKMFQDFIHQSKDLEQTVYLRTLRQRAENLILFAYGYKLLVSTPHLRNKMKQ